MTMRILGALQGAVEYGAVTGGAAGAGPGGQGTARIAAWAAEHQMVLLALTACLLLVWMLRASHRR
jgi:hypothetical protein